MGYFEDELEDRVTREHQWFDAGFFAGALVGGVLLAMLLMLRLEPAFTAMGYFALCAIAHQWQVLQRLRVLHDKVEATVQRWAGW